VILRQALERKLTAHGRSLLLIHPFFGSLCFATEARAGRRANHGDRWAADRLQPHPSLNRPAAGTQTFLCSQVSLPLWSPLQRVNTLSETVEEGRRSEPSSFTQ